ncbi:squalene/phytoene synthase family protein [Parvularcula sp. IMCC14364]|uniref:squalene/phytoene synthase family protein n=1 Tax=Parvularcula sp. IMCC14364 TaxID=3067902 RepID=UPI002740A43A|nr:squalene/phytoene synthase family protein [Parvularcula sp. IMCC14364]
MSDQDRHHQNAAYCLSEVRKYAEDQFISLQFAPREQHARLIALHALALEIQRIPATVSESPLGAIRQQWWRDALAEIRDGQTPRAHPVVESISQLPGAGSEAEACRSVMLSIIDGTDTLLQPGEFGSTEQVLAFAERQYGAVARLVATVLSPDEAPEIFDMISRLEAVHAVSRTVCEAVRQDSEPVQGVETFAQRLARFDRRHPAMRDELRAALADITRKAAVIPAAVMPGIAHGALAGGYLERAGRGATYHPLLKRFAIFRTVLTGRL